VRNHRRWSVAAVPILIAAMAVALVAVALAGAAAQQGVDAGHRPADRVLVEKRARRLTLWRDGKIFRTYLVALGGQPKGDKQCRGDHKTPEGLFTVDYHQPASSFHRALHISYPDAAHRAAARRRGCDPGGSIMIHGLKNSFGWIGPSHRATDWTDGCIAVTDPEIEEIYGAVPNGTPVEIRP
jgi:murein L,D-transpeptidase YafK